MNRKKFDNSDCELMDQEVVELNAFQFANKTIEIIEKKARNTY